MIWLENIPIRTFSVFYNKLQVNESSLFNAAQSSGIAALLRDVATKCDRASAKEDIMHPFILSRESCASPSDDHWGELVQRCGNLRRPGS